MKFDQYKQIWNGGFEQASQADYFFLAPAFSAALVTFPPLPEDFSTD
jgi:hypothetical protein